VRGKTSLDESYHTPASVTKMAPLSPELSPTTENKLHSDFALSVRMLSSMVAMDLNYRTLHAEYNNSSLQKKVVKMGRCAKSHWALGIDHPNRDAGVTSTLLDWLSATNSGAGKVYPIKKCIPVLLNK
jgi:hypothetical protein